MDSKSLINNGVSLLYFQSDLSVLTVRMDILILILSWVRQKDFVGIAKILVFDIGAGARLFAPYDWNSWEAVCCLGTWIAVKII